MPTAELRDGIYTSILERTFPARVKPQCGFPNFSILEYSGSCSASLTYKIWTLSDRTAFSSTMKAAETGWLMSIGYHFGRPLLCSYWSSPDADEAIATLDLFSRSRVFWYSGKSLSADAVEIQVQAY